MTTSRETWEREFEHIGEDILRQEIADRNITGKVAIHASQWMRAKAEAAEARKDAREQAKLEIERSRIKATWVGIAIAATSVISTILVWAISEFVM